MYIIYITETHTMFLMTTRRTMTNANNDQRPVAFMQIRPRAIPIQPTNNAIIQPTAPVKPKMLWGAPTWTFLHTLAALVNETQYPLIYKDLFRIIFTICTNLPCPICSKHAQEYLTKINVNSLHTKQDMILLLFSFHNEVNKRKNEPLFPVSELEKYKLGNYKAIVNNFIIHFQEKTRNIHLIADEMYRQRNVGLVKTWILDNINIIDMHAT